MKMSTLDQKILKYELLNARLIKITNGGVITPEQKVRNIRDARKMAADNPDLQEFYGERAYDIFIAEVKADLALTPEERAERERIEAARLADAEAAWDAAYAAEERFYCPSSTAGDYGPGNPWDAPGMSIHDFI